MKTKPTVSYLPSTELPLTDLHFIDLQTDQGEWVGELHRLAETKRDIVVMHLCDIHFPYQHDAALEVTFQLLEYIQPDVLVVGSDASDFHLVGSFQIDPDEDTGEDVLDEFEAYYEPLIARLRKLLPNTVFVFILGNHEKRIYDFIMRQAPAIRRTVWRRFVEIARQGGEVLWLGETDTVRVGPLLVTHGNRTGTNPAKGLYDDVGGQLSVMSGHVHRLSYYGKAGELYPVEAITSGCLTNDPHYEKRKRGSKWELGTAIAQVDLRSRQVNFTNLRYVLTPTECAVLFERRWFVAQIAHPGAVTYAQYVQMKSGPSPK